MATTVEGRHEGTHKYSTCYKDIGDQSVYDKRMEFNKTETLQDLSRLWKLLQPTYVFIPSNVLRLSLRI